MANVLIHAVVINNKGRVRSNNEDSFLLNGEYMPREKMNDGRLSAKACRDTHQLYAVCDGMGGIDAGEEASLMAVTELAKYQGRSFGIYTEEDLTQVLRSISDKICEESRLNRRNSGTTLVMMAVEENRATLANVGDSRIYRMRGGKLAQVSTDHSEVQRLINLGLIQPEEARTHPRRHVITQFMGMPTEIRISPEIQAGVELRPGDVYLLCSDGLSDMVEDAVIERILNSSKDLKACAEGLVTTALQNGGRDNVTVMLVGVQEVDSHNAPKAAKPKAKRGKLDLILSIGQILVGCGLLATVADFIYFMMH